MRLPPRKTKGDERLNQLDECALLTDEYIVQADENSHSFQPFFFIQAD